MSKEKISKSQLIQVVTDWGEGRISAEKLQDWMVDHYDPSDVEIGPGEAELVQEAMNVVMNEYELAKLDTFVIANYKHALEFLACNELNFLDLRKKFLREAFTD